MKVISTNIGEIRNLQWEGREIQTGIFKEPANHSIHLTKTGVTGDMVANLKAHGGSDKACYLYSSMHYDFWKSKYPDARWEWGIFGENLTIEALDESQIFIGNIYKIGSAVVEVSQARIPCFKLGIRFENQNIVKDFLHMEYPGAYVRVLEEGIVAKNDEVRLIDERPGITLAEVYSLLTSQRNNLELLEKALKNSWLAESMKRELQRIAASH